MQTNDLIKTSQLRSKSLKLPHQKTPRSVYVQG